MEGYWDQWYRPQYLLLNCPLQNNGIVYTSASVLGGHATHLVLQHLHLEAHLEPGLGQKGLPRIQPDIIYTVRGH